MMIHRFNMSIDEIYKINDIYGLYITSNSIIYKI